MPICVIALARGLTVITGKVRHFQKIPDLEYMRALGRQDMRFVTGDRQVGETLSRKELPLTPVGTSLVIADFAREGVPVKPLDMDEGIIVGTLGRSSWLKALTPMPGSYS